jgi:hypothetical protein
MVYAVFKHVYIYIYIYMIIDNCSVVNLTWLKLSVRS